MLKNIFENVMIADPFTDYTEDLQQVWELSNDMFQIFIRNIIENNKHKFFATILNIDIPAEKLQIICDILFSFDNFDKFIETIWKSSEESENYERILKLFTILVKNKKCIDVLLTLKNNCDYKKNRIKIQILDKTFCIG